MAAHQTHFTVTVFHTSAQTALAVQVWLQVCTEPLSLSCQLGPEAPPPVCRRLHPLNGQKRQQRWWICCCSEVKWWRGARSYIISVCRHLQGQLRPVCRLRDVSQLPVTLNPNSTTVSFSSYWWHEHGGSAGFHWRLLPFPFTHLQLWLLNHLKSSFWWKWRDVSVQVCGSCYPATRLKVNFQFKWWI